MNASAVMSLSTTPRALLLSSFRKSYRNTTKSSRTLRTLRHWPKFAGRRRRTCRLICRRIIGWQSWSHRMSMDDRRIAASKWERCAVLTDESDFGFDFLTRLDILSAGRHGGAMQEGRSQHSQVWLLAVFETGLGLSGRKSSRRGIVSRIDQIKRPSGCRASAGWAQGVPTANRSKGRRSAN